MTRDSLSDLDITSTEEFESALTAVVESAVKRGVDVRGSWEFRTGGSTYDWEVEIYELARKSDEENE